MPSGTNQVKWGTPSELRESEKIKKELMKLPKAKLTSKRRSIMEVGAALEDNLEYQIDDFEAPAGKCILSFQCW